MKIVRKTIPFALETKEGRAGVANSRTFTGLASTWDLDLGGDVIRKGAFKKTLNDWRKSKRPLPLLDSHSGHSSVRSVIGRLEEAEETAAGLETTFSVIDGPDGDEIWRRLKAGVVSGLSIGYQATKVETPTRTEAAAGAQRILTEVKLAEVSVVVWPMNPAAVIDADSVKSMDRTATAALRSKITRLTQRHLSQRISSLLEGARAKSAAAPPAVLGATLPPALRTFPPLRGRRIAGWASTPQEDRDGDVIAAEAHAAWVERWARSEHHVPILVGHNAHRHVGELVKAEVVPGRGLWVELELHPTPAGRAALEEVRTGKLLGLSIQGSDEVSLPARDARGNDFRWVVETTVREISLTGAPACPSALIRRF